MKRDVDRLESIHYAQRSLTWP